MQLNKTVLSCEMERCAYNRQRICHSRAIMIGDRHPTCDTFTKASVSGGEDDMVAVVGSCRVTGCAHNNALECTAEGVQVGVHGRHADCITYTKGR